VYKFSDGAIYMKCFVIPVIIGATEIVTKGLKMYLETTRRKPSIDSVQRNSCTRYIVHEKESANLGCTILSRGELQGAREPVIKI
jgi:hypothetical protein